MFTIPYHERDDQSVGFADLDADRLRRLRQRYRQLLSALSQREDATVACANIRRYLVELDAALAEKAVAA